MKGPAQFGAAPGFWSPWFQRKKPMIRLLLTFLVCAVTASQAAAQNNVSQTLFGLSEDQRNETFTRLLQDNNAKCDLVIRTLFNGASVELDVWEALCRDGNSYSVSIPPEPNAAIELSSCRELLATSKMLLEGARSKSKAIGCRITSVERPHRRHRATESKPPT
jgi:hypothetical protein